MLSRRQLQGFVRCRGLGLLRTLLDDLAQRLIHRGGVGEYLSDIRLQEDDICTLSVLLRVLTNHRVAEIVLIQHLNFFILFLAHNLFSLAP